MYINDRRLLRHLTIAVVLKLLTLSGLWWIFVRDERVGVDADKAAQHLALPRPAPEGEAQ